MIHTVKILDSVCREVTTEHYGSAAEAFAAAERLAKSFKRLYVIGADCKMTLWVNGKRISNEHQLEIPLPVVVIPKNKKIVPVAFTAAPDLPAGKKANVL